MCDRCNGRPLLDNCFEAKRYFEDKFRGSSPGVNILGRLIAQYLITDDLFADLTDNFLDIVDSLGEWVAGDEKLLHFTGNSGDIRIVVTKPDRIGLCGCIAATLTWVRPYTPTRSLEIGLI